MFSSKHYWEARYAAGFNSGLGSYGILAEYKSEIINFFIKENNITSLLEYGCGDCNQFIQLICNKKVGVDVSPTAIDLCKKADPFFSFYLVDEVPDIPFDLVLSLDVIYHLIEDEIYNDYMTKLTGFGAKYLIIYSSNLNSVSAADHIKYRVFTEHSSLDKYKLIKMIPNKYYGLDGSLSNWYFFELK